MKQADEMLALIHRSLIVGLVGVSLYMALEQSGLGLRLKQQIKDAWDEAKEEMRWKQFWTMPKWMQDVRDAANKEPDSSE